jgi:hypothetical protein
MSEQMQAKITDELTSMAPYVVPLLVDMPNTAYAVPEHN